MSGVRKPESDAAPTHEALLGLCGHLRSFPGGVRGSCCCRQRPLRGRPIVDSNPALAAGYARYVPALAILLQYLRWLCQLC